MNQPVSLTDLAIREALALPGDLHAPSDLAGAIRATVDATPQRRGPWLGRPARPRAGRAIRLAIAGALLALLAALLAVGSPRWRSAPPAISTYHGGPERTGVMPGPAPAGTVRLEWTAPSGPLGAWSPVVGEGIAYLATGQGVVRGWEIANGGRLALELEVGAPTNGGVALADGVLLVADVDGGLHAWEVPQGRERWEPYATGARIGAPPVVVDGVAYVGTDDGTVHAVDLRSGRLRWSAPARMPGPIRRAVAAAGGLLVVGSADADPAAGGHLAAFDLATGAPVWTRRLQPGAPTTPTVSRDLVVVGGGLDIATDDPQEVQAYHLRDGTAAWDRGFRGDPGERMYLAAVSDGRVFLVSSAGMLRVLDLSTGREAWSLQLVTAGGGEGESPNGSITGDTLVVTGLGGRVIAVDVAQQAPIWSFDLGELGDARSPAIIDGRVLFGTATSARMVSLAGDAVGAAPATSDPGPS